MNWQVQPPDEVITNFDAIQEWLIVVGITVAVLVGIGTLIGMAWAARKRHIKHKRDHGG